MLTDGLALLQRALGMAASAFAGSTKVGNERSRGSIRHKQRRSGCTQSPHRPSRV